MSEQPRFGKYSVVARIGVGGMAEVFQARLSGLGGFDKLVVLKRILVSHATEPEFVEMFLDEARIAANLNHPNIVQIYEVDQIGGVPYIAMEYVRGPTLASLIKRSSRDKNLHYGHAARILSGVCAGLHYAHNARDVKGERLQIVHRDVSPQNVIVSNEGVPKLLDFGVAKAKGKLSVTGTGRIKGKLRYMAPEVLRGEEIDWRADVFAAGVCLYELTTGQDLFRAESEPELIARVTKGEVEKPSKLVKGYPAELEKIVLQALEPERRKRIQTAREMAEALDAFCAGGRWASTAHGLSEWIAALFPGAAPTGTAGEDYATTPTPPRDGRTARPPAPPPPPPPSNPTNPVADFQVIEQSKPPDQAPTLPWALPENLPQETREPKQPKHERRSRWISLHTTILALIVGGALLVRALWGGSSVPAIPAPGTSPEQINGVVHAYLEAAERLTNQQRPEPALELLEKARLAQASDPELNIRLARLTDLAQRDAAVARARVHLEAQEWRGAIDSAKEALTHDPKHAEAAKILEAATQALSDASVPAQDSAISADASSADAAAPEDAGAPGASDASSSDASPPDASPPDAGAPDAGPPPDKLPATTARLVITCAQGGELQVDGRPVGSLPVEQLELPAGEHHLKVSRAGLLAVERTVTLKPGEERAISFQLPKPQEKKAEPKPAKAEEKPESKGKSDAKLASYEIDRGRPLPPGAENVRLPATYRVRTDKDLARVFANIETEAINTGKVAQEVAEGVTKDLRSELGPAFESGPVEFYPRAMYFLIVRSAGAGVQRPAIAAKLKQAHLSGKLKASATQD